MHLYLPIAEVSMDVTLLLGMGAAIGFLSGLFGVGGGFLVTPLLIFFGVAPAVAAATAANTVISPSVSGALSHWRRGTLDVRMGLCCWPAAWSAVPPRSGCSACCAGSGRSTSPSRSPTSSCSARSAP